MNLLTTCYLRHRVGPIENEIRAIAADRNVFFFVSGGVDSTVAYTLCLRALGPQRVFGIYVDTGLMREGETNYVRRQFEQLGATDFRVEEAEAEFLKALAGVTDPETKRHIIGEQFVVVQERILSSGRFLDGNWILARELFIPTPSNPAAQPKPTSSRRITIAWRVFKS